MAFEVKKAKRQRRPLKVSMEGLSGGGKTYTALRLAFEMRRRGIGKRIIVVDSENESAGLYAGVKEDGEAWDFDTIDMPREKRNPAGYTEVYEWAVGQDYDIIIIDSLSHAWHGTLQAVDQFARTHKGDKFGGWADIGPQQQLMIQTLTDTRAHCISTMRVKSDFQDQEVNGKVRKVKVGMKADQKDNTEYEYDIVLRFESNNEVFVEKVRGCSAMNGKTATRPGPAFFRPLLDWWLSAEEVPPAVPVFDKLFAELKKSNTIESLQPAFTAFHTAWKSNQMTDPQYEEGVAVKNAKKDQFAKLAELKRQASESDKPLLGDDGVAVDFSEKGDALFENASPAGATPNGKR